MRKLQKCSNILMCRLVKKIQHKLHTDTFLYIYCFCSIRQNRSLKSLFCYGSFGFISFLQRLITIDVVDKLILLFR